MKKEVGLWIDQHKTVMVTMVDEKEETREIRSNVAMHNRLSGGLPAKKSNLSALSTVVDYGDPKFNKHLSLYYDGVVSMLRNADSICIFGPGEAKMELKKRLERGELGARIDSVETVDKMTTLQIVAKVREHYHISM